MRNRLLTDMKSRNPQRPPQPSVLRCKVNPAPGPPGQSGAELGSVPSSETCMDMEAFQ